MTKIKYDSNFHDDIVFTMIAVWEMSEEEIADKFKITLATLRAWYSKYATFKKAVDEGKNANRAVEKALYKRAIGYDYEEERSSWSVGEEGEKRCFCVNKTMRHIPPSEKAIEYWLNNRTKNTGEWSAKQNIEADINCSSGVDLSKLSDDDLNKIVEAAQKIDND